jgi:hypothetical protein
VNTKASSSTVAAADAALQSQLDTKASADSVAALSSTVATQQNALIPVQADSETEEILMGQFVKGIYGVDPVRISTNVSLHPTDTKAGHIRVRLDQAYQDTLALKADTEAALAQKASSASLTALQSSVALDLHTRADQTSVDALSGFVSQLEPGFVAQAPLVKGFDAGTGQRLLGIPSYAADLGSKANAADTYTKAQVADALSIKADQSSLDATNAALALKASSASVADGLSSKADQNSVDALNALMSTLQPALVALPPLQIDGNVLQMDGSAVPLGKFRLRAQSDAVFLERFDNDGVPVSDSWQTVAAFGFNTDTNSSGLAVQSLSLGGEDLAAALLEFYSTRANSPRPLRSQRSRPPCRLSRTHSQPARPSCITNRCRRERRSSP